MYLCLKITSLYFSVILCCYFICCNHHEGNISLCNPVCTRANEWPRRCVSLRLSLSPGSHVSPLVCRRASLVCITPSCCSQRPSQHPCILVTLHPTVADSCRSAPTAPCTSTGHSRLWCQYILWVFVEVLTVNLGCKVVAPSSLTSALESIFNHHRAPNLIPSSALQGERCANHWPPLFERRSHVDTDIILY